MLNRLFIAVGILAILAIVSAFVVPRFIPWGDFRERMETVAGDALGTRVTILGDIEFALLPQPVMKFKNVVVGTDETPLLTVERVEAEFSLMDFLRDYYRVTSLLLERPRLEIGIDTAGRIDTGVVFAEEAAATNLSIEDASITGGMVVIRDDRSGQLHAATGLSGELQLTALRGPFAFQGSALVAGEGYEVRFTTTALDAEGSTRLSLFAHPGDDRFSLAAEGALELGATPLFTGEATYRQRPPPSRVGEDIRGDLVITSTIEAEPALVTLPAFTIIPDENRASTRLTGGASLELGAAPRFNAMIAGGLLSLPPRDPTADQSAQPLEIVRLLEELPAPPLPGIASEIGVEIAELNLRAFPLRDVRFKAAGTSEGWSIEDFSALMPGNSPLELDGRLTLVGERPVFDGRFALTTERLDAIGLLWRKPAAQNPLFNLPASLSAAISLTPTTLALSEGEFVLDGVSHALAATIGFGETRRIDAEANFAALSPAHSAAVSALLPDTAPGGQFGLTFPRGEVAVTADSATLFGLAGEGLEVSGGWEGGVLEVRSLAARDFGGASFGLALTAFGTVARPELFGGGTVRLADGEAPALAAAFEALGVPVPVRDFLRRSLPADLAVKLEAPSGDGGQVLSVAGQGGVAELSAEARLSEGLVRALVAPVGLRIDAVSADVPGLSAQIGLAELGAGWAEGPMRLALVLQSTTASAYEVSAMLEAEADSLSFAGSVDTGNPDAWAGEGRLEMALADPSGLAEMLGTGGIALPAIAGTADVAFAGLDRLRLDAISASSDGVAVSGELALARRGDAPFVTGQLSVGALTLDGLTAALVGPAALIGSPDGIWPVGPISAGIALRATSGRIGIEAESVSSGSRDLLENVQFDFDWDADSVRVRQFSGEIGSGALGLDVEVCCSGALTDKTVTARVSLEEVPLGALLPEGAGTGLTATLSGNARLEGTGATPAAVIASLAGEGSFLARDVAIAGLSPDAFDAVSRLDNLIDIDPDALATLIAQALEQGPLDVPSLGGGFTVAGGMLRSPNLVVLTEDVRMFGGSSIRLADLSLDGAYTLTPVGLVGAGDLIDESTSQVTARLGGTLLEPERTFDVAGMVDAIQVKAFELELAELERLRAADEARRAAAVEAEARANAEGAVNAALAVVAARAVEPAGFTRDAVRRAAQEQTDKIAEMEAVARRAAAEKAAQDALAAETARATDNVQNGAGGSQTFVLPPLVLTPTEPGTRF